MKHTLPSNVLAVLELFTMVTVVVTPLPEVEGVDELDDHSCVLAGITIVYDPPFLKVSLALNSLQV